MGETVRDEAIRAMTERRDELQPLVDEYRKLEATLNTLKEVAEGPGPYQARRGGRQSLEDRKQQVVAVLAAEPGLPLVRIAERLDLSGPRVGQIVQALKTDGTLATTADGLVVTGGIEVDDKHGSQS